jgi:prepilin-type N-terminal cleavage/methylation domain-containing protein
MKQEYKEAMTRKGVTLIELIIVMVIIAIGAALMVPNIGGWMHHYRLRSAARDVVSVMRTAQIKAVSHNLPYGVAFDTGAQEFQLYRDSGGLQPDGASNGFPTGVTFNIVSFPVDGTLNKHFVSFFPDSTASDDGTIVLTNKTKGVQRTRTVQVSKSTGRIKLIE